jgi:hypothetical protein
MPERTAEEIRSELAAQRLGLDEDVVALKTELRSLVPFVIAGVVAVAILTRGKGMGTGARLVWKLL